MTDNFSVTYVEIDIPAFVRTAVLLHFDSGVDDTGTSGGDHVWTLAGNAQISAVQSKFGGASLLVDGTGDYVTTPDSADFSMGSEDFTVDVWVRPAANADSVNYNLIAGQVDAANAVTSRSFYLGRTPSGKLEGAVANGSSSTAVTGTTSLVLNTWYHAAFVRTGDVLKLFLDGVQEGGDIAFTAAVNDSSNAMSIGRLGELDAVYWNGHVDEFRFTVGHARWTATFDPPTAAEDDVTTYRFAIDADYLPNTIRCIPNIKSISFSPATISLGENLGQRASLTVNCSDHLHIFADEAYTSGTFWGKFRARYGLKLRGRALRLIQGLADQDLEDMETRHYVIESTDGPGSDGIYKIIAKDVLKLADNDRAVAPLLSNGFLSGDIGTGPLTASLGPPGIGAEYPTGDFYVAIGGSEIVYVSARSVDDLTITLRARFNTADVAHLAQDRVQVCLIYSGADAANVLYDLLTTYAGIGADLINLDEWQTETLAYLGTVYTAQIAEPTGVNKLCSELIEQIGGAMWWDDIFQKIRFQVLHAIPTASDTYGPDTILEDSFDVSEQPEKRLSEVQVYFGKINPLVKEDQDDNYRTTARVSDDTAVIDYGGAVIKKIRSRWIAPGGRTTAETLCNKQLGRYRDPPRRFNFDAIRFINKDPRIGGGYQINSWPLQTEVGGASFVPVQVTQLNPMADRFRVEAEEMLWTPFGGDIDPNTRNIIFDASENSVNLLDRHNELYPAPVPLSTVVVNAVVYSGVVIGADSSSGPALDIGGPWPVGVTINLTVNGRIEGAGGTGGAGGATAYAPADRHPGVAGSIGGTGLLVARAINLVSADGGIWGGGGGGGGAGSVTDGANYAIGGGGGGGGGGAIGGTPGAGGFGTSFNGNPGIVGTALAGGSGGIMQPPAASGGAGGVPGAVGNAGFSATTAGAAGGAAGYAIVGIAFVTTTGADGDRRGPQI